MNNENQSPQRPIKNTTLKLIRSLFRSLLLFKLKLSTFGRLKCGKNVYVGRGAKILSPGNCTIGNDIGIAAQFYADANFSIGDGSLISSKVSFIGNDHRFDQVGVNVFWGGRLPTATITLEGDNLIGYGVTVVGSVVIGKGVIVGAGAVVTKNLPPYTVCVGIPARPIRNRFN